jgi:hypothetical protein
MIRHDNDGINPVRFTFVSMTPLFVILAACRKNAFTIKPNWSLFMPVLSLAEGKSSANWS